MIHYKLECFDMQSLPPYQALSYTWGDSCSTFDIQINGCAFEVHENLFDFLQVFITFPLANVISLRYLWVDQICIDQADTGERNHQVSMMHLIYRNAVSVFVWLGKGDFGTEEAMKLLAGSYHALASLYEGHDNKVRSELFDNAYWTRLWIIQEVLLAKTLVLLCGRKAVPWSDLERFWKTSLGQSEQTPAERLIAMSHTSKTIQEKRFRFLELVDAFCANDCQDPRDVVFGLQGLVFDEEKQDIDYSKSALGVFLGVLRKLKLPADRNSAEYHSQLNIRLRLAERLGLQKYSSSNTGESCSYLLRYWKSKSMEFEEQKLRTQKLKQQQLQVQLKEQQLMEQRLVCAKNEPAAWRIFCHGITDLISDLQAIIEAAYEREHVLAGRINYFRGVLSSPWIMDMLPESDSLAITHQHISTLDSSLLKLYEVWISSSFESDSVRSGQREQSLRVVSQAIRFIIGVQ